MNNILLKYALRYSKLGLSIIPLHSTKNGRCTCGREDCPKPGKHPVLLQWKEYQSRPATEEEINDWWTRWPRANIGIVTGAVSGIIVLDVDGPTGEETIKTHRLALPPTRCAKTGGGGWHYYFRHPGEQISNFVKKLPGIDLRADGGYVVAPPSLHSSGNRYEWSINPAQADLADPPNWLLELIQTTKTGRLDPEEWEKDIPEGQRNEELTRRAGSLLARGIPAAEVLTMLLAWNEKHCKPPLLEKEVRAIVESIAKRESQKPPRNENNSSKNGQAGKIITPVVTCLADIEPEEVSWLWYPYIPLGKLTILEGDPGIGKTWLALQIAASVSTGNSFPDSADGIPKERREPANVLYLSAEDGLGDTLRPRLDKAGADVSRVFVLQGWTAKDPETGEESQGSITLQHIPVIRQAIENYRPALLVIDPLQAYLGAGVDMHRANEVRPVLSGLASLAEEYGVAVLLIRHLGKSQQDRAIYRGLGSIDFSAAARSILLAGQDPQEPGKRALIQIKNSLAAQGPAIGYELRDGQFFWTGLSDLTAASVLAPEQAGEEKSALDEAIEWLRDVLSNGPLEKKEIVKLARDAGIISNSDIRLRRAKDKLRVKAIPVKEPNASGKLIITGWKWTLPDNVPDAQGDHLKEEPLRTFDEHLEHEAANPHHYCISSRCSSTNQMSIWKESSNIKASRAHFPDAHYESLEGDTQDDYLEHLEDDHAGGEVF